MALSKSEKEQIVKEVKEVALDATSLTSRTIFSFSFLDNATAILQLKPFGYSVTNCKITI